MGPKKKGKGKEEPEVKNKEDETEQVITKYTLWYIFTSVGDQEPVLFRGSR